MDRERRKGDIPIPDDLKEVLNNAQLRALAGIECLGWRLRFIRRPMFQEPVFVVHYPDDDRIGILGKDGKINMQSEIRARELDKQVSDSAA
jgi:hypothetical protein